MLITNTFNFEDYYGLEVIQKINKKKKDLIIVIDNVNLIGEYIKKIIAYLPQQIQKYKNIYSGNLYLITIFPKIKVRLINIYKIYYEFNKIPNTWTDTNKIKLIEVIQTINEILKKMEINPEILFCTTHYYKPQKDFILELGKLNKLTKVYWILVSTSKHCVSTSSNILHYNKYNNDTNLNFSHWLMKIDIFKLDYPYYSLCIENSNFIGFENNNIHTQLPCFLLIPKNLEKLDIKITIGFLQIIISHNFKNIHNLHENEINITYLDYLLKNIYNINHYNNNNVIKGVLWANSKIKNIYKYYENKKNIEGNNNICKLTWMYTELRNITSNTLQQISLTNKNNNIIVNNIQNYFKNYIENTHHLNNNSYNCELIQNIIDYKNIYKPTVDNIDTNNKFFIDSCDFFFSPISLDNWYDGLHNSNSFGLLLNTKICGKTEYKNSYVEILDITNTFISIQDYYDAINLYFNSIPNNFGDLNDKKIFFGRGIGNSNTIIPIYINKYHWDINKQYFDFILSTTLKHNPFGFSKNNIDFMFKLLTTMTWMLFYKDLTTKFINSYFAVWRTCVQLSFENNYFKKLPFIIKNILLNPHKRASLDFSVLFGQILCQPYKFINNINDINILVEFAISNNVFTSVRKLGLLYNIFQGKHVPDVQSLLDDIHNVGRNNIEKTYCFYKMIVVLSNLINNNGGLKKFLNELDNNYGIISEKYITFVKNNIVKLDEYTDWEELYSMRNFIHPINSKASILNYAIISMKYPDRKIRTNMINHREIIENYTHKSYLQVIDSFKNSD
jgi:hypothetical protein